MTRAEYEWAKGMLERHGGLECEENPRPEWETPSMCFSGYRYVKESELGDVLYHLAAVQASAKCSMAVHPCTHRDLVGQYNVHMQISRDLTPEEIAEHSAKVAS